MSSIDVSYISNNSIQGSSEPIPDSLAFDWKNGLAIAFLIWVNVLNTDNLINIGANSVVWVFLILWSLTGTSQAVRAVILGYVLFAMNPGLFDLWPKRWTFRWFLLFSAAFRVFYDWNMNERPRPKWLLWFLLFLVAASLSSVLKSYALTVSVFKILAFAVGFFTIAMGVNLSSEYKWYRWIYTFWVVILLSSLPLIPTKFGYTRGKAFQGILNHPQEYGVFFAIPAALLTARLFFDREEKLSPFHLAVLSAMWGTIIIAKVRTGVFAVVLAFFVTSVVFLFRRLDPSKEAFIKPFSLFAILLILAISVLHFERIYDAIFEFSTKGYTREVRQGEMSVNEAVLTTRTQFIIPSLQNFEENPLLGIGFGIASDPSHFWVGKFYGISVTARTEKGFVFSALLEETGILGTLLFLVFIIVFSKDVLKFGNFSSYMFLLTAFFVTFGEMGFFSPGAKGLYVWFCMAIPAVKNKTKRLEKEYSNANSY